MIETNVYIKPTSYFIFVNIYLTLITFIYYTVFNCTNKRMNYIFYRVSD